jgi:hypothetical protein
MSRRIVGVLVVVCVLIGLSSVVLAAAAKAYQWTGKVVEITDSKIVVQKGDETWEIGRDADTKVTGDVKVGDKVKVQYRMVATAITAKEGAEAEADKPAAGEGKKDEKKE